MSRTWESLSAGGVSARARHHQGALDRQLAVLHIGCLHVGGLSDGIQQPDISVFLSAAGGAVRAHPLEARAERPAAHRVADLLRLGRAEDGRAHGARNARGLRQRLCHRAFQGAAAREKGRTDRIDRRHPRQPRRVQIPQLPVPDVLVSRPVGPRHRAADRHQLLHVSDSVVRHRPLPRQDCPAAQLFLPADVRQLLPAAHRRPHRAL